MSYTFTPEGIRLQKLLKSKNWGRIFLAINKFRHLKGWELNSDEWFTIERGISEDVLRSPKIKNDCTLSGEELTKWLLGKFDFDFVELHDIDRQSLKVK